MRIWTKAITEKQWTALCKILKGTLHEMEEFAALAAKARLDSVYVLVKGKDRKVRIGVLAKAEYAVVEYRKKNVLYYNEVTKKHDIVKFEYTIGYALQGSDPWRMLDDITSRVFSCEHDEERREQLAKEEPYVVFGIQPIDAVSWYYPHRFVAIDKKITKVLKFPK